MSKLVIILGAGATRAQSEPDSDPDLPSETTPPLDHGFFSQMPPSMSNDPSLRRVARYLKRRYHYSLGPKGLDSFELVASMIYTDTFATNTQDRAYPILLDLIQILAKRIAQSTNDLIPHENNPLQRVLQRHFEIVPARRLSIVTFNYDLQAERALHFASSQSASRHHKMSFPGCYRLENYDIHTIQNRSRLVREHDEDVCHVDIPILKLHGSLNWYTPYNARKPSKERFLSSSDRAFRIANSDTLPEWPLLTKSPSPRRHYGYPLLVPPVPHKSALFHADIKALWVHAADEIASATELLFFGYSCPSTDQEAANLVRSAVARNRELRRIAVIDPSPSIAERVAELTSAASYTWYRSVYDYLK